MPSVILGPVKITNSGGNVSFGDVFQIAPKSAEKSYSGSGGGNNGDFMQTNSLVSLTNTLDSDLADAVNVATR